MPATGFVGKQLCLPYSAQALLDYTASRCSWQPVWLGRLGASGSSGQGYDSAPLCGQGQTRLQSQQIFV